MPRSQLSLDVGSRTSSGTRVTAAQSSAMEAESLDNVLIYEYNAVQIQQAMNRAVATALEEIGLVAERFAKTECPVDTGRLRNSITHAIDMDEQTVYVGSNVEYAPVIELGTRDGNRKGVGMLTHAANDHATLYRQIVKKHLEDA